MWYLKSPKCNENGTKVWVKGEKMQLSQVQEVTRHDSNSCSKTTNGKQLSLQYTTKT